MLRLKFAAAVALAAAYAVPAQAGCFSHAKHCAPSCAAPSCCAPCDVTCAPASSELLRPDGRLRLRTRRPELRGPRRLRLRAGRSELLRPRHGLLPRVELCPGRPELLRPRDDRLRRRRAELLRPRDADLLGPELRRHDLGRHDDAPGPDAVEHGRQGVLAGPGRPRSRCRPPRKPRPPRPSDPAIE